MELEVKLEVFEGPLDLLLHLIEKNKLSIYDIPIVLITEQYLDYVQGSRYLLPKGHATVTTSQCHNSKSRSTVSYHLTTRPTATSFRPAQNALSR